MNRPLLPPRPSGVFGAGFPTSPARLAALWDGKSWTPRGWAWLRKHAGGVERVDVYMADDPEGATFVATLGGGHVFAIVYADRDVLAGILRRMRSLARVARESTEAAVKLLEDGA